MSVKDHAPPPATLTADIRDLITLCAAPVDPYFDRQWHLQNTGQGGGVAGVDIRVTRAWDDYTGVGVAVGVWDDGIEYTHPDLDGNYDATRHIRVGGRVHDPYPQDPGSEHGTSVAGVIAAEANGSGTVGVAFGATVTGVDIFYDPALDFFASFRELDRFDVTNHSWGWVEPFVDSILDPEWDDFYEGWQESVITGRGGLGTINLVAAGNDREFGRNANDSNLANQPQTIAVAAVADDGFVSWYSTPGACVLISAPSSGGSTGIWTTDRVGANGYSDGSSEAPLNADPNYTADFGGTSSATPTVSGVVALMLQANPELGWRDVQDILAYSARHTGSAMNAGPAGPELYTWRFNAAANWNGGGLHFSNDYGFGLVDATAAVRLAETWTRQHTSANWEVVTGGLWSGNQRIPDGDPKGFDFTLKVTEDIDLEMIGLQVKISGNLGDYRIEVTSPGGTTSTLGTEYDGITKLGEWLYTSNAFRGEDSVGTWRVHVSDRWDVLEGTLTEAELLLSGAAPQADDVFVFTEEFSDFAGRASGPRRLIHDTDGGIDTINAAAIAGNTVVDLAGGTGRIDGVTVKISTGIENICSGDGNDALRGDARSNRVEGGRGRDSIDGGDAPDALYGGNDHDFIVGASGRDRVYGEGGDDELFGGTEGDVLRGGDGDDYLFDGRGTDTLFGGDGRDKFGLLVDGDTDTVRDFRNGADTLGLAGLAFDDLSITNAGAGRVRIDYGSDRLYVEDGALRHLVAADFTAADFAFA